ncbi:MAG: hypothetical protein ABSA39_01420 [Edaphobacter sp.]
MRSLILSSYIAFGMVSYVVIILFICRFMAFGGRKDDMEAQLSKRLSGYLCSTVCSESHRTSDCPALSAILGMVMADGVEKRDANLVVGNWPHSSLILELTGSSNQSAPLQLLAYHYRFVEDRFVRECEMVFNVFRADGQFHLRVCRYLPAHAKYLKAFAMLWSDELIRQGYLDSAQFHWKDKIAA